MSFLDSPIDLSLSIVGEPGPGMLVVATVPGAGRFVLAAAFALAAAWCAWLMWQSRAGHRLTWIWPGGLLAPVFALISFVFAFGRHEKAVDASARRLTVAGGFGPVLSRRTAELPRDGVLRLSVERESSPTAGGAPRRVTRRYSIDSPAVPALSFVVASDRDAARAFASKLSGMLGWRVEDASDEDGR